MRRMRLLQHVHDQAPDGKCVENIQAMAEALALVADRAPTPAGEVLRRVGSARSAVDASGAADRAGTGVNDNSGSAGSSPASSEAGVRNVDPHHGRRENLIPVPPPRPPGSGHHREAGDGPPRRRRRAEESVEGRWPFAGVDIDGAGKVVVMPGGGGSISEFVARSGHARAQGPVSRR